MTLSIDLTTPVDSKVFADLARTVYYDKNGEPFFVEYRKIGEPDGEPNFVVIPIQPPENAAA